MSSFIVGKREFIKAAGLMCGYEEGKRDSHQYFIDVVRKKFEHAYTLNVVSVNEQYGDTAMPETEAYDDVFEKYRKMGKLISMEGYTSEDGIFFHKTEKVMKKEEFRKSMFHFFGSVLYQIENEVANMEVSAWFYTCLTKLYEDDYRGGERWWGKIDLAA